MFLHCLSYLAFFLNLCNSINYEFLAYSKWLVTQSLLHSFSIQTSQHLPSQPNHIPHKTLIAYNTPHQLKPITMQAYHCIDMYTTDQMIGMSYASYLYARGTINSSLNILTRASPGNPLVRFSYKDAMSLNLHLITWYVTMGWFIFPSMMLNIWLELLPKYIWSRFVSF